MVLGNGSSWRPAPSAGSYRHLALEGGLQSGVGCQKSRCALTANALSTLLECASHGECRDEVTRPY